MTLISSARPPSAGLPAATGSARDIAGVLVSPLTRAAALAAVGEALDKRGLLRLAFCNSHMVNLAAADPALGQALRGFLVLSDGIGVDIGSRLLYGTPFPANLNGTDFIPKLLEVQQATPRHVMLLGGRPGVAERAARNFAARFPAHRFSVLSHGYFKPEEGPALLSRLAQERPDLLLVAFGNPRQEKWIAQHLDRSHCSVAAGVGALLDFTAGEVPRAPKLLRRLRLEWIFRLAKEPRRLWRRYVVGNPAFLLRVLDLRLARTLER